MDRSNLAEHHFTERLLDTEGFIDLVLEGDGTSAELLIDTNGDGQADSCLEFMLRREANELDAIRAKPGGDMESMDDFDTLEDLEDSVPELMENQCYIIEGVPEINAYVVWKALNEHPYDHFKDLIFPY